MANKKATGIDVYLLVQNTRFESVAAKLSNALKTRDLIPTKCVYGCTKYFSTKFNFHRHLSECHRTEYIRMCG